MTTTTSTSSDPAVSSRRLLFIGGIVFTVGALLEFALGALNATVGPIPLFSFVAPLVLAAGAVLLALGNIGGRSVLAKIGLFAYAAAFAILMVAVLAAAGGAGIELLFPLGGTMLTLGMLVAGIEVARAGAVGAAWSRARPRQPRHRRRARYHTEDGGEHCVRAAHPPQGRHPCRGRRRRTLPRPRGLGDC
jgi:hypothetical protein